MSGAESNRYCDYARRLRRVGGLSPNIPGHPRSLHEFPHPRDPRREGSLRRVLEFERAINGVPLVVVPETNYELLLRPFPVPDFPSAAPALQPSGLPNTRDPRRARACERNGYSPWNIGPSSLVENETLNFNEETCPVLIIDVSNWPSFKRCWIELLPHERNAARAALEIQLDEVEGFDAGGDDPMLELGTDTGVYVECVKTSYRREDEVRPKCEPTDTRSVTFVDLCDEDDVIVEDGRVETPSLPPKAARSSSVSEIVILDDDEDEDIQFVEIRPNSSVTAASMSMVNEEEEEKEDGQLSTVTTGVAPEENDYQGQGELIAELDFAVNQFESSETQFDTPNIHSNCIGDEDESVVDNSRLHGDRPVTDEPGPLVLGNVSAEVKGNSRTNESFDNKTTPLEKRKSKSPENLRKNVVGIEAKRQRSTHDENEDEDGNGNGDDGRSKQRSCEHRILKRPVNRLRNTTADLRGYNLSFRLLLQYVRSYNITWSCLNYLFNHYRDLTLSQISQVTNIIRGRKTFSCHRYNQRYEKENCVFIEDVTEIKGCDKILRRKSPSNNEKIDIVHQNYQLSKSKNIVSTYLYNNNIFNPVIENVISNKSQELQLNLISSNSIEVFPSTKQNSLCSAALNNKYEKLLNNTFDIQHFKKHHSLPTAPIPEQHNIIKRFRSKSQDLSIKLTLKKDQFNKNKWIAMKNSIQDNVESTNASTEYINQITENSIIHSQDVCNTSIKVCKKNTLSEVPELEMNDYNNKPISVRNINNFENCLSPYLKSLVKKRSLSFKDINIDSNKLCKRRKLSNNFISDNIQRNMNSNIDIVKSLENNLQTKSLLSKLSNNYSKKQLPKTNTSTLSKYNFSENNDNQYILTSENVHKSNNIASSSSLQLNRTESNILCTKDKSRYLSISKSSYSKYTNGNMHSNDKQFSNDDTNTCLKILKPKNVKNNLSILDYNVNDNQNSTIEKDKEKEKSGSQSPENYININICEDNSLRKECISDIEPKSLQLVSYNKRQLDIITAGNQLLLQLDEFCGNDNPELQIIKENNLNISSNNNEISSKRNMLKINTDNTKVELQNKDLECNESNKMMIVDKNTLEYSINRSKNKENVCNSKEIIGINNFEDNISVVEVSIEKNKQKQNSENYSDQNSSNIQEIQFLDIADSPVNVDQVLPDSPELDEHLEEGDFEFLPAIQKIKCNSECYDDYDMNSDCDVEFEDHTIECSISAENTEEKGSLINKTLIKNGGSTTNDYQNSKPSTNTKNLQEIIPLNNTHCLKKLPDFYNECITKIVGNKAQVNDNTNIDIASLNLYISDDNDNNVQSDLNSETTMNSNQNEKMKSRIIVNLDDKNSNNLNKVKICEKEKKKDKCVEETIQSCELEHSEKEQSQHIEIEDIIISLCENYVPNNSTDDSSLLDKSFNNQLTSTSSNKFTQDLKNVSSPLTLALNESTVHNMNLKNCTLTSSKEITKNYLNSHSSIYNQSSNKDKSLNLSNEAVKFMDKNNDCTNFKVIPEFKSRDDGSSDKTKSQISMSQKNNLQLIVNESIKINTSLSNIENHDSRINSDQSINLHDVSSPIVFEISLSNNPDQSNNYDLLKNININLVDEIDEINTTSLVNSTASSSSKQFKLRDINELLEKPEKISEKKNINPTDKLILPSIPVSDTTLYNPFSSQFIYNKKNNLPTKKYNNQFNPVNDLITFNNSTQSFNLNQHQCNNLFQKFSLDQSMNNSSSNTINSTPVNKSILNYNVQQPCSQSSIQYPMIYSALKSSTTHQLENISKNNYSTSNNNSASSTLQASSNISGDNRKIVLASSIYSNYYADTDILSKHTVFSFELPPLENLSLSLPYIVNLKDSFETINRKIIEYKKVLLNKIYLTLKSKQLSPHEYKKCKNTLLNYNTLTEDIWNFQLKIITIKQCVFSFINLTTNKTIREILQAIINSMNPAYISKECISNLNDIIELYHTLQQKKIISKSADNKQPLLLELEIMENKKQRHVIMTKVQQQRFISQVLLYHKINKNNSVLYQPSITDLNYCENTDGISQSIIPLQYVKTVSNDLNTTKNNSLQNSSFKDGLKILPISNTNEVTYQTNQNSLNSNNITTWDANSIDYQIGKMKSLSTIEKRRSFNELCLKCNNLSQIVCCNCKSAAYCSSDCQQKDWTETHHKTCKNKNIT